MARSPTRPSPLRLWTLFPEERRKVYGILNFTVEPLADGGLQVSGAFGEETPVWEDVRTSRRSFSNANPSAGKALGFTLILREGAAHKTAFGVLGGIQE
jgi:hypothetical protein